MGASPRERGGSTLTRGHPVSPWTQTEKSIEPYVFGWIFLVHGRLALTHDMYGETLKRGINNNNQKTQTTAAHT